MPSTRECVASRLPYGDRRPCVLAGFGASADLVLQLAYHQGCEVHVFTRGIAHRQLAEKLEAIWTGAADEAPPRALDAWIIFAPAGTLVPQARRHLRKGGTLALAGITITQISELDYDLPTTSESSAASPTAPVKTAGTFSVWRLKFQPKPRSSSTPCPTPTARSLI